MTTALLHARFVPARLVFSTGGVFRFFFICLRVCRWTEIFHLPDLPGVIIVEPAGIFFAATVPPRRRSFSGAAIAKSCAYAMFVYSMFAL